MQKSCCNMEMSHNGTKTDIQQLDTKRKEGMQCSLYKQSFIIETDEITWKFKWYLYLYG